MSLLAAGRQLTQDVQLTIDIGASDDAGIAGRVMRGSAAATALGKADEVRTAVDDPLAQRSDLRVSSVAPKFMPRFARDEDREHPLALLRRPDYRNMLRISKSATDS